MRLLRSTSRNQRKRLRHRRRLLPQGARINHAGHLRAEGLPHVLRPRGRRMRQRLQRALSTQGCFRDIMREASPMSQPPSDTRLRASKSLRVRRGLCSHQDSSKTHVRMRRLPDGICPDLQGISGVRAPCRSGTSRCREQGGLPCLPRCTFQGRPRRLPASKEGLCLRSRTRPLQVMPPES